VLTLFDKRVCDHVWEEQASTVTYFGTSHIGESTPNCNVNWYTSARVLSDELPTAAFSRPRTPRRSVKKVQMNNTNLTVQIKQIIGASIAVERQLLTDATVVSEVARVSEVLVEALGKGNKSLFFGNGGSAADAQHLAAEFVGRFGFDRPALPALALSVNSSCVTAVGNDYGFDLIFARQIEAFGRPGDVAIGISTSGLSRNVIRGISLAKQIGLRTVALTGATGGKLKSTAEHCICVPSKATARIQECHILLGHIISELVEQKLFREHSEPSQSHQMPRANV